MESEGKWKRPKNRLRVQIYIGFSLFRSVFLGPPPSLHTPTKPQTHWGSLRILINGLFIEISVSCLVCWTFSRSSQLAKHTPSLANPINQFRGLLLTTYNNWKEKHRLRLLCRYLRNLQLFARAITELLLLFFFFQQLHRSTTSWWWTKTTRVMRTVQ